MVSIRVKLDRNIGEGSHSVVRLARDLDTLEPVAVKVMNLKKHGLAVFEHEVAMLRVANHENSHRNVPRLLGHVESGDKGFLVLEYLPFPTLSSFIADIGALGFDSSVYILYQIIDAIGYLLKQGLAHRDIKSENIMINPDNLCIKLIDFSLTTEVKTEHDNDDSYRGTPIYMAPEVLARNGNYAIFPAEMWSAGVIFWECLLGQQPFDSVTTQNELSMAQSVATEELGAFSAFGDTASSLLSALLQHEPRRRPRLDDAMMNVKACLKTRNGSICSPVKHRSYSISKTRSTKVMDVCRLSFGSAEDDFPRASLSRSSEGAIESRSNSCSASQIK